MLARIVFASRGVSHLSLAVPAMRALAVCALALGLVACSASRPDGPAEPPRPSLLDVWTGLDGAEAAIGPRVPEVCDEPFGTWFTEFGTRGLACKAAQVVAPAAVLGRAPVAPFRSGPHAVSTTGVDLDLGSARAFGHYDARFVEWLAEAALPEGAARVAVRPIYRAHAARLARVYWLTHADLVRGGFPASTPAGPLTDYAAFLSGGPGESTVYDANGGFSVFAFTDRSERLLPQVGLPVANDWEVKYEANTAYGFWLRRRADGTHGAWHDGLRRLLAAFDGEWLAAHGGA